MIDFNADRRGSALLAVLWIVVAAGALALVTRLTARSIVLTTVNRSDLLVARWKAEGCAARGRAAIDQALSTSADAGPVSLPWIRLDGILSAAPLDGCDVHVEPWGARIDINTADEATLRSVLSGIRGSSPSTIDSLVDAVLDWRDPDQLPRPSGAEGDTYQRLRLPSPRNGPFGDVMELARVRGGAKMAEVVHLFGVNTGRISINHAPAEVLRVLPGASDRWVASILERRQRRPITSLLGLGDDLDPATSTQYRLGYAHLASVASVQPEHWQLVARSGVGEPPATIAYEILLTRRGRRTGVVRHRMWIE